MQKNETSLYFIVGCFVLFGFASVLYLAFKVSGLATNLQQETYQISAEFSNIGGLNERSKVSIAGVTVGRVETIYLNPETLNAVVTMNIDRTVDYLTTDTVARILTSGLLGEKYVELLSGGDDAFLEDGSALEEAQGALVLEDLVSRFLTKSD